ncbi:hypothetical protein WAF17_17550 [Bernardetia sp. ABR2-2B]|uniref:hypothetical protein n=1 Tax=Bernardetia sp. ABR2-2B TaxID=3127472 RepID=UPI0030CB3001
MFNYYLPIYLNTDSKKIFIFLACFIGIIQNTNALTLSFELGTENKKYESKTSDTKNIFQKIEKSSKKTIFESKSTKTKTKKRKVSLRKKLSILKLVLKSNRAKKRHRKPKLQKGAKRWNGQHTAGLVSWASILVAVMAFFTGSIITGILFSCVALLAFLLASSSKQMSNSSKIIIWFFIGLLLVSFFAFEFPLLTEFILYLL